MKAKTKPGKSVNRKMWIEAQQHGDEALREIIRDLQLFLRQRAQSRKDILKKC